MNFTLKDWLFLFPFIAPSYNGETKPKDCLLQVTQLRITFFKDFFHERVKLFRDVFQDVSKFK